MKKCLHFSSQVNRLIKIKTVGDIDFYFTNDKFQAYSM